MALALPTVRHILVCFLKHWSGSGERTGAERAENLVSGSGAMSGCKNNHWSGSGAGNAAESGSHKNRFERGEENMPLPLRSHALLTNTKVYVYDFCPWRISVNKQTLSTSGSHVIGFVFQLTFYRS